MKETSKKKTTPMHIENKMWSKNTTKNSEQNANQDRSKGRQKKSNEQDTYRHCISWMG